MFTVFHDVPSNLVDSTLSGFFDLAEVSRYAAVVEPIIARAAPRRNGYAILLDISGCAIQSQEVVAAFQHHVAGVIRARRCAVVVGGSIIRMQIRRIINGPSIRMFECREEARAWAVDSAGEAIAA